MPGRSTSSSMMGVRPRTRISSNAASASGPVAYARCESPLASSAKVIISDRAASSSTTITSGAISSLEVSHTRTRTPASRAARWASAAAVISARDVAFGTTRVSAMPARQRRWLASASATSVSINAAASREGIGNASSSSWSSEKPAVPPAARAARARRRHSDCHACSSSPDGDACSGRTVTTLQWACPRLPRWASRSWSVRAGNGRPVPACRSVAVRLSRRCLSSWSIRRWNSGGTTGFTM